MSRNSFRYATLNANISWTVSGFLLPDNSKKSFLDICHQACIEKAKNFAKGYEHMPSIADRLDFFTESVIREMTRVANEHGALNLSQGFPDFDPPAQLVEAAKKALDDGHHQYAITWGAASFRKALAEKQKHWMGLDLDPDANIVVTCGSTEAMMVAMMTAVNPGDKVIVFSPFYENYGADTILSGADPIYVPLHPPEFAFDPDELKKAFEKGARALVLCNPSNPTGKVFSKQELEIIADMAKEHDAFVITDEVYEHIVYEPFKHTDPKFCSIWMMRQFPIISNRRWQRIPKEEPCPEEGVGADVSHIISVTRRLSMSLSFRLLSVPERYII